MTGIKFEFSTSNIIARGQGLPVIKLLHFITEYPNSPNKILPQHQLETTDMAVHTARPQTVKRHPKRKLQETPLTKTYISAVPFEARQFTMAELQAGRFVPVPP